MDNFERLYALWDEFLVVWPAARLSSMTLDEYALAGSRDTFTSWIESRLDQLGSIWGGSAFKFGVFSRKDTDAKESDSKLSYSATHAWYSTFGATAEEAFERVRGIIVKIAELAARGDLDGLENLEGLGQAVKWKVAFHYQNRNAPSIVDIFKKEALAAFVGESSTMGALQKATMGILEFGRQTWEAWSLKNLAIWKLSHGINDISSEERERFLRDELAVLHEDTAKGQAEGFREAAVGALFYLCHGNEKLLLIGQFVSGVSPCEKGDGWLQRSYRILKPATRDGAYEGVQKGWTPNYRSPAAAVRCIP
jgi:5-methylcytosine-specific restriction protein B